MSETRKCERGKDCGLPNVHCRAPECFVAATPPTPDRAAVRDAWVIWSHEHAAYWRAERRGYTVALVAAGVYSEAEAKAIAAEVSRDPSKLNEARSLASELARCGQGTVATLLRPAPLPAEVRAAVERVRFQQAAGCPASLEDIDTLLAHLTREAR